MPGPYDVMILLIVALLIAQQQTPPPPQTVIRDATAGPNAAAARPPLPPPTPDAQRLLDQLKQDQANIIEQLRFLQQQYRDNGRAEDAAVIAAHIRQLQQR